MRYKAVGFDYGGVIVGKPGFNQDIARILGIKREQLSEVYFKHNKKVNRGEVNWRQLWSIVLEELGFLHKLEDVMKRSAEEEAAEINKEVFDLVDTLRKNGYKTGLLSNNSHVAAEKMRKVGIDKHFDVFHISAETGFVKPEHEAFKNFVNELGVKMQELIYIDDAEKSLSTSHELGYTPILFANYERLKSKLLRLKII